MKIYNTMTRRKEEFTSITPGEAAMYVCGQTVYNYIHIGNARVYVVFDTVRKYLEYKGYSVRFAMNFTDVDDKIIARSIEEGVPSYEIAKKYIDATLEDIDSLGIERATVYPKATEEMNEIIDMVKELIESGSAYERNGSVFFNTSAKSDYGKLSGKNTEELEAGARVEINEAKQNPSDFVLWKPAKQGEPFWESPWGRGRPGWHIECSAMIRKFLGKTIDIHGGGEDLIFPHHENEIAQSETVNCVPLANYFMHNGQLTMGHKKMSKSVGNFFTLREVAERFPYDAIRFYLLSAHYRSPMEYGEPLLHASLTGLSRIKKARGALSFIQSHASAEPLRGNEDELLEESNQFRKRFEEAMDDDFNTADAISVIFEFVRFINKHVDINEPNGVSRAFAELLRGKLDLLCGVLGIRIEEEVHSDEWVEKQIAKRQEARRQKNFMAADRIRRELKERGILLEDTASGVRWTYEK